MHIDGSANSMMYQAYAEMAQQRRLQGTSGTEEPGVEAQAAAGSGYAAYIQTAEIQQNQQAQEVAPSMEVGDRSSQNGNDVTIDSAQPGGRGSNASELLRLLGANTEGMSAAAALDGESTQRRSFMNEVLKTFSDAGTYESAMRPEQGNFNSYMQNLIQRTYGA